MIGLLFLGFLPTAEPPRPVGLAVDLRPPVHVCIDGQPLDVQRAGYAAPFLGDIDGDGIPDLLVGEYQNGALRIYPGKKRPGPREFGDHAWFRAGGTAGRIPSG